jgi:dipeptidyl aminopeptidase/acylaminoacyl peptidase
MMPRVAHATLGVVLTGLIAVPAHGSFRGANGLIAFAIRPDADSSFAIHTMNAAGKRRRQLTTEGWSRNPAWSRDGRKIAFDRGPSDGERARRLWLMKADGTGQRQVPMGAVHARNPSWSPNGRRLVFQGCGRKAKCKRDSIFVVRVGGGGLKRIADEGVDPVWSPNGRWIAYAGRLRSGGCSTLNLVRPSGKRRRAVAPAEKDPRLCTGAAGIDFSPDSGRLVYYGLDPFKQGTFINPGTKKTETVYAYHHAMYTVDVDGKHRKKIASRKAADGGFYFLPFAWSPDGDALLWRDDRGSYVGWPDRTKRRIAGRFAGGLDYAWQALN